MSRLYCYDVISTYLGLSCGSGARDKYDENSQLTTGGHFSGPESRKGHSGDEPGSFWKFGIIRLDYQNNFQKMYY